MPMPMFDNGPRSPFPGQFQVKDNWCWAAVAASVKSFFDGAGLSGTPMSTQCEVARIHFGMPSALDACGSGRFIQDCPSFPGLKHAISPCPKWIRNQTAKLIDVLLELGLPAVSVDIATGTTNPIAPDNRLTARLVGLPFRPGFTFDEAVDLLNRDFLVCLRVANVQNPDAHFIVVYGYDFRSSRLCYWDPNEGSDKVTSDDVAGLDKRYIKFTNKILVCKD